MKSWGGEKTRIQPSREVILGWRLVSTMLPRLVVLWLKLVLLLRVGAQRDGSGIVRVLFLRKGERCLAVPKYPPLCFLKGNGFACIGEGSICFKKFIPLSVCDFAEQLHEDIFLKSTITSSQKESHFKFFEVFFLRIVPHITL